ncbi:MAG: ergothioneine biosynthesis protein EgtB [Pseudomonadota bacterium]
MDSSVITTSDRATLVTLFQRIRRDTERLCKPLETDDYSLQSMVQTSPPKWHLAHVSWFFEAFVLPHFLPAYQPYHPSFDFLFNSYYITHGEMLARAQRGMLSRPTVDEVYQYRSHVNSAMQALIEGVAEAQWAELVARVTLGLNHEQQHQELLLMDVKHNFSVNPLKPAYRKDLKYSQGPGRKMNWVEREGGIQSIGHAAEGFAYDNETPRHKRLLHEHRLADRFINNGEYLEFIEDGGYSNPALWLSDGWALIQGERWSHPLYWKQGEERWQQFTLGGMRELNIHEPVCHLSFYEADAYARWSGKRLPLEDELEALLGQQAIAGNFADSDCLHPMPATQKAQWFGDLWAWTTSPYTAYPGFKPLAGSMGEYNGKFMSNQMVLKGGSCITPANHTRASYRNFFYPNERWAFTGLRLAEDA